MVLLGILIGVAYGIWRAKNRGGNRLDMAQWATVHAIIFGLVGLALTILVGQMG